MSVGMNSLVKRIRMAVSAQDARIVEAVIVESMRRIYPRRHTMTPSEMQCLLCALGLPGLLGQQEVTAIWDEFAMSTFMRGSRPPQYRGILPIVTVLGIIFPEKRASAIWNRISPPVVGTKSVRSKARSKFHPRHKSTERLPTIAMLPHPMIMSKGDKHRKSSMPSSSVLAPHSQRLPRVKHPKEAATVPLPSVHRVVESSRHGTSTMNPAVVGTPICGWPSAYLRPVHAIHERHCQHSFPEDELTSLDAKFHRAHKSTRQLEYDWRDALARRVQIQRVDAARGMQR